MATLILDSFVDTNGVELASHIISPTNTPGTTWAQLIGDVQIQSNKAATQSLGTVTWTSAQLGYVNVAVYTLDAGVSDCTIKITFSGSSNGIGVVFRFVDHNNFWYTNFLSGTTYVISVVGGTETTLHSVSVAQDGTMSVALSGNTIQWGSAALEGSITSSLNAGNTKHGIFAGAGGNVWSTFEIDGTAGGGTPIIWELRPGAYNPGDTWRVTPHTYP